MHISSTMTTCNIVLLNKGEKVKVYIYISDILKVHWNLHQLPPIIGTHSFTVSFPWGECRAFSAVEAIHTVPIFVPPGTHYCWVARGGIGSSLAQGLFFLHDQPRTP